MGVMVCGVIIIINQSRDFNKLENLFLSLTHKSTS